MTFSFNLPYRRVLLNPTCVHGYVLSCPGPSSTHYKMDQVTMRRFTLPYDTLSSDDSIVLIVQNKKVDGCKRNPLLCFPTWNTKVQCCSVLIIILVGHVAVLKNIDGPSNIVYGYVIGPTKLSYWHQTHFLQGALVGLGTRLLYIRLCSKVSREMC